MSTYEDDHNITTRATVSSNHGRQHQTLSSIIDTFLHQDTQPTTQSTREAFTNALRVLNTEEGSTVALQLLNSLDEGGLSLPLESEGVSQDFLDSLQRVSIKDLPNKDVADCAICTNKFVDDEYPLLVRLPCDAQTVVSGKKTKGHVFDLECIGPWLKVNPTCPLCRFDVLKASKRRKEKLEEELRRAREEDDEEEEDDIYG